jgi:hypothetical protein
MLLVDPAAFAYQLAMVIDRIQKELKYANLFRLEPRLP